MLNETDDGLFNSKCVWTVYSEQSEQASSWWNLELLQKVKGDEENNQCLLSES
jgi:3-phenylpropionate/cinnamic acid dioxygenase small subunit